MAAKADFRSALVEYIRCEARPIEKYSHQPRLYALATQVGEGQVYDDDVLFAAAWIHDLGVFQGHRPEDPVELERWDNVRYAIAQAPGILVGIGFPAAKIPAVLEAVRTHQPSFDPITIEGVILRDADILEQLGAVGIVRTVCKIGRDTRFSTFADAVESLRRALSLPGQLRLEGARRLAASRTQVLEAFLQAIDRESQGLL
jgi:uncharacterized protein